MFSGFFITLAEVVQSITLSDVVRAVGNESMALYNTYDPELIREFVQMLFNR